MSSKFAKQYSVPPEFPEILKDFTREVLRNQPSNINEFAAKYFDCLAHGLPPDVPGAGGRGGDLEAGMEDVESIIQELFKKYDTDGNYYLDPHEFQDLMNDMQERLDFPKDEIIRFLAEADMNADGKIEYEEFIPLALQIIQGMYAKKRMEQKMATADKQAAESILVHGMSRQELTDSYKNIFRNQDKEGSGVLSKQDFVAALTSMDLGLTRREINAIMFRVTLDGEGNIAYGEFAPYIFDLLQKMTSMRLLETELEDDELMQYLSDLFKAKDVEMAGVLHVDDVRDVLHQAMLGLTRMQIYAVISEAEVRQDMMIAYESFVPRAVGLVRTMVSFEQSIVPDTASTGAEAEREFKDFVRQAGAKSGGTMSAGDLLVHMESSGLVEPREMQAIRHFLSNQTEVDVDHILSQMWTLVKNMRQHRQ
eukprot:TRINITY_DN45871_c0_g1_i1.p1 TRINITY_DN45871_c0_g1~~TRINITY_DN45871_c0_g1_i1.p1  ORF type:complete len:453 (-),score=147.50 TRINITY_DN45871_c0_g1_i1:108-1376(-)